MSFLAIAKLCRAQEGSIARSLTTSLQSVAFYWLYENQRIFLIYLELFYCYPFRCFYSFHLSMVSSVMTLMQRLPGVQLLSRPSCSQSHCVINICLLFFFFLSVLSWAYIDKDFIGSSTKSFFENIKGTYMSAYDGIKARLFNKERLYENFNERLLEISQEGAIPRLNGTTDIYSYNQSYLLAAGNLWSPRPVIQSHGAYTPKLARLNELHLLSERAPNNIVFKVEPIDGRLASLEDGLSWPILIYNYIPFKLEKDFVYLRKKISRN